MMDDRIYEMEKTAVAIVAGILGTLVVINLALDLFGRVFL